MFSWDESWGGRSVRGGNEVVFNVTGLVVKLLQSDRFTVIEFTWLLWEFQQKSCFQSFSLKANWFRDSSTWCVAHLTCNLLSNETEKPNCIIWMSIKCWFSLILEVWLAAWLIIVGRYSAFLWLSVSCSSVGLSQQPLFSSILSQDFHTKILTFIVNVH